MSQESWDARQQRGVAAYARGLQLLLSGYGKDIHEVRRRLIRAGEVCVLYDLVLLLLLVGCKICGRGQGKRWTSAELVTEPVTLSGRCGPHFLLVFLFLPVLLRYLTLLLPHNIFFNTKTHTKLAPATGSNKRFSQREGGGGRVGGQLQEVSITNQLHLPYLNLNPWDASLGDQKKRGTRQHYRT